MGSLTGVTSTFSGWRGGLEVVDLQYDPALIDYKTILAAAEKFKCTSRVYTYDAEQQALAEKAVGRNAVRISDRQSARPASDSDQKYYLRHTDLRHLPLTEIQATKINAALKTRNIEPTALLSKRQSALYARIQKASKDAAFKSRLSRYIWPTNAGELKSYTAKLETLLTSAERSK